MNVYRLIGLAGACVLLLLSASCGKGRSPVEPLLGAGFGEEVLAANGSSRLLTSCQLLHYQLLHC